MVSATEKTPPSSPLLLNGETLIGLTVAGKLLPGHRANNHINSTTVWRWIRKGVRTASGTVVRLEAVRVGARWLTSREAVARFIAQLTAASCEGTGSDASPVAAHPLTARNRHAAASAASAELDRALRT